MATTIRKFISRKDEGQFFLNGVTSDYRPKFAGETKAGIAGRLLSFRSSHTSSQHCG
jgi:hypothetical protein